MCYYDMKANGYQTAEGKKQCTYGKKKKSFTEFPAGKLKSKITLRSSVSFLETVFNGEILK